MGIMQESSKARDRTLGEWFQYIQQGQVKLPRFQRYEAWDRGRITSFLNTIIKEFNAFMRHRTKLVHNAIGRLADGEQPSLESIWRVC